MSSMSGNSSSTSATAVDTSPQAIGNLLAALTQPDTNTIRQAEQALKPILKNPASMLSLWTLIADPQASHDNIGVRHVGAIVLRKRLPSHYGTWDDQTKNAWQQQILNGLATEQSRPVRAGLVGVAAALAQIEQTASAPMLAFLAAAVNDANPAARELCFLLLQEMTETVGTHWKPHLAALQQLFGSVLHNATEQAIVQKAAVQALGQLMSFWADEEEIEALAPLLPVLLQVASQSWSDEDFLTVVLDVLYDLAYSPASSLAPHMPLTVEFALTCLRNRELELRVRDAAALVIATTAEAKPKTLGRADALLGAVLDTLFQLMQESPESAAGALFDSNPAWRQDLEQDMDANDDDDGLDSPTETSMAQGTLDMIACELPKKYVWPAALSRCIDRMNAHNDANARKAGVAGLGVIAEGCCEPLTAALPTVMPMVFAAAQDSSPQVRECACFCLGQISEHCQPEILQYSNQILPIVFALLDDQAVTVQATSCYVLEMFCERLEPDAVRPLLDPLVRKLAHMLEQTNKRSVQEMAVAALAATAVAAEQEFSPYVEGVAKLMTTLMSLQDPTLFSLRGRALECMGHMAIAVGKENFRPYFTVTMECAMQGLTLESTDLQEFAYAVFANLAKVMKEEFAPALSDLVPHLIQVVDMDEGQVESAGQDSNEAFTGLDESDDEGDNEQYVLHVRTGLMEVKKGAITALGEMGAHCGTDFCPYLEVCMKSLEEAASNWHPLIKSEAADAMPSMIVPSIAAYHNGEISWTKGDVTGSSPLSPHTAALVHCVLKQEIVLMQDDDKGTVGKACEAVQSVIEICGPHALVPHLNECLGNAHLLLTKSAPCQTVDALYGELPDDDDDHDGIMQAVCDLVGGFGRVLGSQFAQYLGQFLPAICEYGKSSRPASDRSMAVGCLSEIAQELENSVLDYWPTVFLPAILSGLADEDDNVKRNAAFCVGVCCEYLKEAITSDYQNILQQLAPIFNLDPNATDSSAACIDNAAAAVARMIMASPHHVPLGQVLPVFWRALPLKTDMTENETVYTCLLGLLSMKQPDLMTATGISEVRRIVHAACQAESDVSDEIKAKLIQAQQTLQ